MATRQVITILTNGGVSGLQVKPGRGLDISKMGRAKITRASEILWNEEQQCWYVDVLQNTGKGPLTIDKWHAEGLDGPPKGYVGASNGVMLFGDYENAVAAEIAYLDAMRKDGRFDEAA